MGGSMGARMGGSLDSDFSDIEMNDDDEDAGEDDSAAGSVAQKPKAKKAKFKPKPLRGRLKLSDKLEIRRQLIIAHKRYGHVDPRKLITAKRLGRFHSSSIPTRGRRLWSVKDCPVCLAMRYRKPPAPARRKGHVINDVGYTTWDQIAVDLSGPFRTRSYQGNRYYALFKCMLTGKRMYFGLKKRSHFTITLLRSVARMGKWPKLLISDKAGEIVKKTLKHTLTARQVNVQHVPRGEHHLNGSIEADIGSLDNLVKTSMMEANLPAAAWECVGQHIAMLQDCIRPCPSNEDISCHEAATGEIPDIDLFPPVGCLACQNLADKKVRSDFKLSPANRCGVFLGLGELNDCPGALILHENRLVVGHDNVTFLKEMMPLAKCDTQNPTWEPIRKLLQDCHGTSEESTPQVELTIPQNVEGTDDPDSDPDEVDAEVTEVLSQISVDPSAIPTATSEPQMPSVPQTRQETAAFDDEVNRLILQASEQLDDDPNLKAAEMTFARSAYSSARVRRCQRRANAHQTLVDPLDLLANKTLIIGSFVDRDYGFGHSARGTIVEYDAGSDRYHILFPDGQDEYLHFDDLFEALPDTKANYDLEDNDLLFNKAYAHAASTARFFKAGTTATSTSEIVTEPRVPADIACAQDKADWRKIQDAEYYKLEEKGCWKIVRRADVPEGANIIRSRWVFKVEYAKVDRRKSRIVACGYDQRAGVDYASAYSPTVSQVALRFIMGLTAAPGWLAEDYDAENAFISAVLPADEVVYMEPLEGYDIGEENCLMLIRCLYGLAASSRHFFMLCREIFTEVCGFKQIFSDQCIFVKFHSNVKGTELHLEADDLLRNGYFRTMPTIPQRERRYPSCPHAIAAVIIVTYVDNLALKFNCRELKDQWHADVKKDGRITLQEEGTFEWFLGLRWRINPFTGETTADMEAYSHMLLHRHGMMECNPSKTPIDKTFDIFSLPVPDKPSKQVLAAYASLIGKLQFLATNLAIELSRALHLFSKFMTKAGPAHLQNAKQMLRYVKFMASRTLRWCATTVPRPHMPFEIYGFCDASWADDKHNRKSAIFYVLMVNGGPFAWRATTSTTVANSTAEAELYALAPAVGETIWARQLAFELHFAQLNPTKLYEDNEATIKITHHELSRSRTKHIALKYRFVHNHYVQGTFDAVPIAGADQPADLGATLRDHIRHQRLTSILRGNKQS